MLADRGFGRLVFDRDVWLSMVEDESRSTWTGWSKTDAAYELDGIIENSVCEMFVKNGFAALDAIMLLPGLSPPYCWGSTREPACCPN